MHDLAIASGDQIPADSVPKCSGAHCQSVPMAPPVEPSRVVVPKRHPIGILTIAAADDGVTDGCLYVLDETIPASVILEVVTPPPIDVAV
jgi:hypothetical protein